MLPLQQGLKFKFEFTENLQTKFKFHKIFTKFMLRSSAQVHAIFVKYR